ncbi:hypothetical protein OG357_38505 (plasmid) [Streptomyces sp. NBC_01255]|uniref:hypothetical protein n=1 Tax=Streptomyces sp. NBC_01255 TaxID=2903798 RepID=UPI002E36A956|nr:hypothetical protein [Streptomyces sp. NBC_01255]
MTAPVHPAPATPGSRATAPIAVVLDHTTATALHDPHNPFHKAMEQLYDEASKGFGALYVPALCLTAADACHPGLLASINSRRFIQIEAFDTAVALTTTGIQYAGYSWAAIHAIHAARPSADFPTGRCLLTLTPELYEGTGVHAFHPDR